MSLPKTAECYVCGKWGPVHWRAVIGGLMPVCAKCGAKAKKAKP